MKLRLEKPYLGNNIPNPFNRTTRITYFLPWKTQNAFINISDMYGKEIKRIPVKSSQSFIEIELSNLEGGIYFYDLEIENMVIGVKRMVLLK